MTARTIKLALKSYIHVVREFVGRLEEAILIRPFLCALSHLGWAWHEQMPLGTFVPDW
jgi:hypothetical protein